MITKFEYIKNTGVFKNFTWQESFEEVDYFNKLNIFYGQNYSGKTTLSKIFRSLEIGSFSKNYENAEFKICIENNLDCSQNSLQNHNKVIRVFNEDFINDNLKFIIDSEEMIKPFAILGEKNNEIEKEIEILQKNFRC